MTNLYSGLSAALLLLSVCTPPAFAGMNKVLTDVNFEHDTQASTGQTTGIWLVRFCSPKAVSNWCVDGFVQYWADLCEDLLEGHHILTGTVDVSKNLKLAKRFDSPILDASGVQFALFKDGGMYLSEAETVDAVDFTKDEVKAWVLEGYASGILQEVPPEPTFAEALKEKMADPQVQRMAGMAGVVVARGVAGVVVKTVVVGGKKKKKKPASSLSPLKAGGKQN